MLSMWDMSKRLYLQRVHTQANWIGHANGSVSLFYEFLSLLHVVRQDGLLVEIAIDRRYQDSTYDYLPT